MSQNTSGRLTATEEVLPYFKLKQKAYKNLTHSYKDAHDSAE